MKRNLNMSGISPRRGRGSVSGRAPKPARPDDEHVAEPERAEEEEVEEDEEDESEEPAEEVEESHGPDDALGLYLREMGSIPLLNREQELALAKRLESTRDRYRAATFLCPGILTRLHQTFVRIHQGQFHIDPTIEVVASLGLTRESILKRLQPHLRTLGTLLKQHDAAFTEYLSATSSRARRSLRHKRWRLLRKASKLAVELSPRTELLERWHQELLGAADGMTTLARH